MKFIRADKLSKEDAEKARGLRAAACLWEALRDAKARTEPATWITKGGPDAEAALFAWDEGRGHGFFTIHQERQSQKPGHPPPELHTTVARQTMLYLCKALERCEVGPHAARKLAAKEASKANLFRHPVSLSRHIPASLAFTVVAFTAAASP
jgi:hypothetical protein